MHSWSTSFAEAPLLPQVTLAFTFTGSAVSVSLLGHREAGIPTAQGLVSLCHITQPSGLRWGSLLRPLSWDTIYCSPLSFFAPPFKGQNMHGDVFFIKGLALRNNSQGGIGLGSNATFPASHIFSYPKARLYIGSKLLEGKREMVNYKEKYIHQYSKFVILNLDDHISTYIQWKSEYVEIRL